MKKNCYKDKLEIMPISKFICVPIDMDAEILIKSEDEVKYCQVVAKYGEQLYFSPCSGYVMEINETKDEQGDAIKVAVIQNDFRQLGEVFLPLTEFNADSIRKRLVDCGLSYLIGEQLCVVGVDDDFISNDNAIIRSHNDEVLKGLEYLSILSKVNILHNKKYKRFFKNTIKDSVGKKIGFEDILRVYLAIEKGIPNIYKVITVAGASVAEPKVLQMVKGSEYGDIMDFCKGEVYPLREYNKILDLANDGYGHTLDLKEEYFANKSEETAKELIETRKQANKNIFEFLKIEKKYGKVLLKSMVYGDFAGGKTSGDFNQVVTEKGKGMLLLNERQTKKREEYESR